MKAVYYDGSEYVIARSEKHADAVWEDSVGGQGQHDSDEYPWEKLSDELELDIGFKDYNGKPDKADIVIPRTAKKRRKPDCELSWIVTAKCKAWAKSNRCTYLCGEEY